MSMKNIFLLPTIPNDETEGGIWIPKTRDWCNIYITSDENKKMGDYVYDPLSKTVHKVTLETIVTASHKSYYKIILTTDQDLIDDGVQAIDDAFLEWFVKNPSCKELKIDLVPVNEFGSEITVNSYGLDKFKYKIIIPKKEPKKSFGEIWSSLTTEQSEYLKDYINKQREVAKNWQQEQDKNKYSEEEVREILTQRCLHFSTTRKPFNDLLLKQDLEWFEQNKKK